MHTIIKTISLLFISIAITNAKQTRPNIVFILSDDQAWSDYGFMGHKDINTPNLDKLSEQGLTFKRGYVAAPICRPSLASIITGVSPTVHGITANDSGEYKHRTKNDPPFREAFHKHPNFVKLLSDSGYLTLQTGKWWEGTYQEGGFTHGMTHADPNRGGRHGDEGLKIGRTGMKPINDFIDLAIKEDKPFFVWYAPFLPHTPHNPPARLLNKYKAKDRPQDITKYYAMCEWFDETCGQLLNHIDQKKLTENTVVIYACDNGWAPTSTRANDPTQKNWKRYAQRSKSSPFENGIRSPIMIRWHKKISPLNSTDLAHTTDIFPTIATLANIDTPKHLQGINLLNKQTRKKRSTIFGVTHSSHNMTLGKPDQTLQYQWAIEANWKLIIRQNGTDNSRFRALHHWDNEPFRLYNLITDPTETNNLASKHPEKVAQLKKKIDIWHAKNLKQHTSSP